MPYTCYTCYETMRTARCAAGAPGRTGSAACAWGDKLARMQIGPVLAAYVRELVKLVPGSGFFTNTFEVQDALEPLLDAPPSEDNNAAARIINRCLQVYGSGNQTIDSLYDTPVTPY